jgi:nucleotide-binding universal stress UspA family protein
MSEHWIIGIDGSSTARSALRWAVEHAPSRGARLTLVHVVPEGIAHRVLSTVRHDDPAPTIDELDPNVAAIVRDLDVEYITIVGSVSKALATSQRGATLLVLGRHGAGGRWHHTLGSVSRYCATHASVPVVLVPDDWEQSAARVVTVGFDGSRNAASAIAWAAGFADVAIEQPGATVELRALMALDIAPWLPADVAEARLKGELHQHESDLRARLDDADPLGRFRRDVVVGDARVALARAADRTDILVIGARGNGVLGSTLLGSVSTWMLDAAGCPLVVVPTRQSSSAV